ncbi:xanthine dehydrogenase family protein molybdopterin-binding subunit [Gramella sp. MT6]|uniref:xanthine dehydrogenase family protein molybdopterin-binding subunit n=1 Tax=Gramella sp. MT6 TaxID=2705471 RepID=UPI001C5F5A0E|nr:molybdopterin cofactor-binding domain-containing protein [Gramella sp. MT6]QYA24571.1 xanthine dehydrogenase family protein molybdopterin-binding subunit [Gramella sp. MT6]
MNKITRRTFIKNTGYVAIGFSMLPQSLLSSEGGCSSEYSLQSYGINDWLQVLEDGKVKIFTGKMELGQGIRIAIAQVAAEELNMNIDLVEVHLAETKVTPNEGYTAGSRSIVQSAMNVRKAAAAASNILLEKAATKYDIPKSSFKIQNGKILNKENQKLYSFQEILNGEQIEENVPNEVILKPKSEHQLVGSPVPRKDILKMLKAEPVYVQDLRFPGMVHARIARPPAYQAVLEEFNPDNAKKLPSVIKVIRINNFIGVLAQDEYQAQKAKELLEKDCEWKISAELNQTESWKDHLKAISSNSETVENTGNFSFGNNSLKASYSKPYVMHGSIGPSCAVAFFNRDKLQVWTHSQGVYPLQETLADLLDLNEDQMQITGVPGSGCYGHNGADDVAAEAALLATKYPGKHIRLQWSRADEHSWEPYGSAMIMDLEASLDDRGKIKNWNYELWSDTHSTRPGGNKVNLLPASYYGENNPSPTQGYLGGAYRNAQPYYSIENRNIKANFFKGPLRVSALRGLGAYANIFAIESFMDELAEKAEKDPLQFRLDHLSDSRAIDILNKLKQMTSDLSLQQNDGIGYAFSRYKNTDSYFGVAAKVRYESSKISIKKMWGVIDSGEVINPDGLRNQTEGGMIQSASWTMLEEVKFDKTHVTSLDWETYPIFRIADIPQIEVQIIDRPYEPPLGAGEAAQGATAAAIVNAIYNVTRKRVRDLPVSKTFEV